MPDKTGAPHGGAALLRHMSVLAEGKNLGVEAIHLPRAAEIPPVTIKITTPDGVVIFMAYRPNLDIAFLE